VCYKDPLHRCTFCESDNRLHTRGGVHRNHFLPVQSLNSLVSPRLQFVPKTGKGKSKVHPRTGHERREGEYRHSSTLSLTLVLGGVGGQRHAPAAVSPGKRPGTHFIGGWVGSRDGLDGFEKYRRPTGFDPWTFQPVASRYTDCAIPARTKTG
jgi:hypothetical protein